MSRAPLYRVVSYLRYTVQEDVSSAVVSCRVLSSLHARRRCLVRRCIVSYLISVTRYKKMSRTPLYRVVSYFGYTVQEDVSSAVLSRRIVSYNNVNRTPLYRVVSFLGDFMDIVH